MISTKRYFNTYLVMLMNLLFLVSVTTAQSVGYWFDKDIQVKKELKPSYEFADAAHVANGISMRNRTAGTIHLRGIPYKSKIVKALLYFNFLDMNQSGEYRFPILFNGNRILANKTADHRDPCWDVVKYAHTYVADVTSYVNTTGSQNQDYRIVLLFDYDTDTDGANPWDGLLIDSLHHVEGASLIAVYQNHSTKGDVFIYDKLNKSMFNTYGLFYLFHPPFYGPGLLTMAGADGQLGEGYDPIVSNEVTIFNGIQIAGPPITNSDWDGSDGWPLNQLWDTHTHPIKVSGNLSRLEYKSGYDCLIPAVFVIDITH